MGMIDALRSFLSPVAAERADPLLSMDEFAQLFSFGAYPLTLNQTLAGGPEERIEANFTGLVQGAYKNNGVVFACMLARQLLFSEARFQFRQVRRGQFGDLFGSPALSLLETPWPGATTGDLLARMLQDADLAGNCFIARRPGRLKRLRPDWVTIVLGSSDRNESAHAFDIDAEVVGYIYHPGGRNSGHDPVTLLPNTVAHFAPIPDPAASFRGMSWLTPVIREIMGDSAATTHKLKFFENGATPNMVVSLGDKVEPSKYREWISLFEQNHQGVINAYKTLYLGGGASAEVVGANLRQIDFKSTQGAGETRIAAAAGVPPIIVGLSEGLQAATYSNYGQARRRFADLTMRPLWRNVAGSLAAITDVPAASVLWYDDHHIAFLSEDLKDAAEVQSRQAQSIKALTDAGYESASVIDAITSGDLRRLKHTGLFSVQLQPPGSGAGADTPAGRALLALADLRNGNGRH